MLAAARTSWLGLALVRSAASLAAPASRVVVVGGGASGYFAAITAARAGAAVTLLEKTRKPLKKVLLSGGGRCNVLHDPRVGVADFVARYPRGARELRGPYAKRFGPEDAAAWFAAEGVGLKTEADGRVFPTTDDSRTVAAALRGAAARAGVDVRVGAGCAALAATGATFEVRVDNAGVLEADAVVLATGSAPGGYALAKSLGHDVVRPYLLPASTLTSR